MKARVGIIGGSGIYDFPGLDNPQLTTIQTPWGAPSASLRTGRVGQTDVVFLPRHGVGHHLSPSGINYRANIDALKQLGVTDLISLSACGSFRAELYPGLFVVVDQFVDRTYRRQTSFFGNGCVGHVSMAHSTSPLLTARLVAAAKAADVPVHQGGTYVCIEGPQFSSLAESLSYKDAGYDVIGMTAAIEAKLAREAEMSYACVSMVTDFDCWHVGHGAVDVAEVVEVMHRNSGAAQLLISHLLKEFPTEHEICPAGSNSALEHAIMTAKSARDPDLVAKLQTIAGRVLTR